MTRTAKNALIHDYLMQTLGCALIAFSVYNVALYSDFPLAGLSGIALLLYHFYKIPIGASILIMNIPLALLCLKRIGKTFMIKTVYCMIISSLLVDYVMPLLPIYNGGDQMLSAIMVGVLSGAGYAFVYMSGSSTGGTDFVTMIAKYYRPHLKLTTVILVVDVAIIVITGAMFATVNGIIYGIIIDYLMTVVIDHIILGRNSGNIALIVVDRGEGPAVSTLVEDRTDRGATIMKARGGYQQDGKDVVMVAGSTKDIYMAQKAVKAAYPRSFIIVLDSKEVHGEGFQITTVAGEDAAQ